MHLIFMIGLPHENILTKISQITVLHDAQFVANPHLYCQQNYHPSHLVTPTKYTPQCDIIPGKVHYWT